MSSTPFLLPRQTPVNGSGRPYPSSTLTVYRAGTTTLATIYSNSARTVPLSNPLTANSAGQFPPIYASPDYNLRIVHKTSAGVTLSDDDNIGTTPDLTAEDVGAALYPLTATEIAAGVSVSNYGYPQGNVKRYGAVGDGVADDTIAVHAAIDVAKSVNGTAFFPQGKYRVTSGYVNDTVGGGVTLLGEGVDLFTASASGAKGSSIILDSTSTSSFFYSQEAGNQLNAFNLQFLCAQYVLDRKFFVTSASPIKQIVDNCHFVDVEQPFVFDSGTYFQMCSYKNTRFTSSGTFHSKQTSLTGTVMLIENCEVEETIPENTEKVICNLQGIRQIHGTNFVIEPATPSTGWTALYLNQVYDADWTRFVNGTFRGLWIEVPGSGLTYTIRQVNGRTLIIAPSLNNASTAPIRLEGTAAIELREASFSGDSTALQSYFSLASYTTQVSLSNCTYRNPGTAITHPQFRFDNCSLSPSDGVDFQTATAHGNEQSQLLWAFDGGFVDSGKIATTLSGGTTIVPTVNASYGRALNIVPSGNAINATFQGRMRGDFPQGGQMFVVARGVLPTIPSGTLELSFTLNGTNIAGGKSWTATDSGASFLLALPATASAANPTNMGVTFSGSASTNLVLYQLELWVGKSLPNVTIPVYPANVITFNTAAPSGGEWARGDVVWNSTPSAGGTPGWVCTTGGTPGTWKAMANVAA